MELSGEEFKEFLKKFMEKVDSGRVVCPF